MVLSVSPSLRFEEGLCLLKAVPFCDCYALGWGAALPGQQPFHRLCEDHDLPHSFVPPRRKLRNKARPRRLANSSSTDCFIYSGRSRLDCDLSGSSVSAPCVDCEWPLSDAFLSAMPAAFGGGRHFAMWDDLLNIFRVGQKLEGGRAAENGGLRFLGSPPAQDLRYGQRGSRGRKRVALAQQLARIINLSSLRRNQAARSRCRRCACA
jgi:hypothetical protein